ncbi:hypothetical protein BpHYR1_002979 [Brachionus plicatilis]|uniref:Uncharacterized protein n=1 Tax=Brachionus plicatilis TaxID=10195 RepID=A0A3M7RUW3_BRAPC|nr:hypothetical protein BpHYR1_002979 [Brachionus plicatilis]
MYFLFLYSKLELEFKTLFISLFFLTNFHFNMKSIFLLMKRYAIKLKKFIFPNFDTGIELTTKLHKCMALTTKKEKYSPLYYNHESQVEYRNQSVFERAYSGILFRL